MVATNKYRLFVTIPGCDGIRKRTRFLTRIGLNPMDWGVNSRFSAMVTRTVLRNRLAHSPRAKSRMPGLCHSR